MLSVVYRSERLRPHRCAACRSRSRRRSLRVFAALGRFVYRHRRIIVVLWAVAFVAGLVATTRLPGELKGGGFTNPATPSQAGTDGDAGAAGLRPGAAHDRVRQPQSRRPQPRFPGAGEGGSGGPRSRRRSPSSSSVQTAASTGDAGFISKDGHATFAVLSFDASTEQVQRMIPAVRARLAPTGPDHLSHRRPRGVRRHRADLRRGSPDRRDVHPADRHLRPGAHLRDPGGRRPAGDRRRHGRDRHAGRVLGARPVPRPLRVRDERGHAARAGRRHRLLAVHGGALSRGAGRRPHRGGGGGDHRGVRRPLHLLLRADRGDRAARPGGHPLHVDALDGAGRRARGGLLRARRPDAVAGAAGHSGRARGSPARHRALGQAGDLLGALVARGHAPSRPRPRRDALHRAALRLAGAAHREGDPRGDRAPAALRVAAGLRHPAVALRRVGAVADLRPRHVGRGLGGAGAGEPAAAVRVRPTPPGHARRRPRDERRQSARRRDAGGGGPLLAGRATARRLRAAAARRRPSRPAPGPARRPAARGGAAPARAAPRLPVRRSSRSSPRTPRPRWRRRISP